jgi:glycyl-tRNA synthetase beta chain
VVRPRLSDAKFFFEQDKKKTLAERVPQLANVVYHNKLGTQLQRTERVQALAGKIAALLGGDVALAERGALLAKADLLTDMVGEFPELQGIMGTYYARMTASRRRGLAASEHYQPRFAGDALPPPPPAPPWRWPTSWKPWSASGHRPAADRRQGPVRAAPPCAGRAAHAGREAPAAVAAALDAAAGCSPATPASRTRAPTCGLHLRPPARCCASAALRRTKSKPWWRSARRLDDVVAPGSGAAFAACRRPPLAAANKRITNILKKIEGVAIDAHGAVRACCRKPPSRACSRPCRPPVRRSRPPCAKATSPAR